MSLMVYITGEPDEPKEAVRDVEGEFILHKVTSSNYVKSVMSELEQGKYVDSIEFEDRFGVRRSIYDISTGSKAAILVETSGKPVDLVECGYNAKQFILAHAKNGAIIMDFTKFVFEGECDIVIKDRHFSDLSEFSWYIQDEIY